MLLGVALVLAGSMAHATWNVLVKAGAEDGKVYVLAYSICVLVLTVGAFGVRAAFGGGAVAVTASVILWGLASAALHTSYALSLQWAYKQADLSLVYPVARGVGPLLAVLFGLAALGEAFGLLQAVGTALVLVGMFLCARVGTVGRAAWMKAATFGTVVGCTIAAYTIWDDYVMARLDGDPVSYYLCTVLFQVFVLVAVCRRTVRTGLPAVFRAHSLRLWTVGALVSLSYVSVLYAMRILPLSVVAPLRASSVVFGTLGAILFLRESGARGRLFGSLVVFGGIGLIVAHA